MCFRFLKSNTREGRVIVRVRCIANTGQSFLEKTIENLGNSRESTMPLKIGEEYVVYGQMIYKDVLNYLVIGTYEQLPTWYPAEVFEITSSLMYYEEYYMYNKDVLIQAIWGFKELVLESEYVYRLVEREKWAVEIFLRRKKAIDEFEHD